MPIPAKSDRMCRIFYWLPIFICSLLKSNGYRQWTLTGATSMLKKSLLFWRPASMVPMLPLYLGAGKNSYSKEQPRLLFNMAKRQFTLVDERSRRADGLKSPLIKAPADPSP
ncbi:MAG: hypothetical protein ABI171_19035 [Collimonas sp.]|uniref:hypothetical protein n=1 Tax=Collimonas sp. TaxID=1963772 RepID=UPI0032656649